MVRRKRFWTLVGIAALALSGSVVVVGGESASASAPAPVTTFDADPQTLMPTGTAVVVGTTGFVRSGSPATGGRWTRYDTGESTPIDLPAGMVSRTVPMGGDRVGYYLSNAGVVSIVVRDFGSGVTETWPIPSGYSAAAVYGHVLIGRDTTNGTFTAFSMAADGAVTSSRPVTGGPTGAVVTFAQFPDGIAASWSGGGAFHVAVIDPVAATITEFATGVGVRLYLSDKWIATYNLQTRVINVYSRAGIATGADITARTINLPVAASTYSPAIVGDAIVATNSVLSTAMPTKPAVAYPIDGGAPTTIVALAGANWQGAGGTAMVLGGSGPGDWAFRRIAATADGFTDPAVMPLPSTLANAGLTISRGLVRHVESLSSPDAVPRNVAFNHALAQAADQSSAPGNGALLGPAACGGAVCVAAVDGPANGPAYLYNIAGDLSDDYLGFESSSANRSLTASGSRVLDASPDYVVINTTAPAQQLIVKVADLSVVTRPVAAAAVWYDTLYRATGAGMISVENLAAGTVGASISTGTACTPTELQATAAWLYWTCGAAGPAGVVDLLGKRTIAAPAGLGLLGDGYLVTHEAGGALRLYDFHGGSFESPVTLASVPAGPVADDRNIAYAVDRFSGDIAYVDAADAVHVIDPGVPMTAPSVLSSAYDNGGVLKAYSESVHVHIVPSRPLSSWTFTITNSAGGTVYTQSGGATSRDLDVSWDGRTDGTMAYSGRYQAKLRMVGFGDDSVATVAVLPPSGAIVLNCGRSAWRVYGCDGRPAFLAVTTKASGEAHWFSVSATGSVSDNGPTDLWPSGTSASTYRILLPFGDLNIDGDDDFLAVDGAGNLKWYQGVGSNSFESQWGVIIGTGWGIYNTLLSPGDLDGDHTDDLVARDAQGRLWLYRSVGAGSLTWKPRVQIAGSWSGYRKIVGAGDLNGDGNGDLVATDSANVLWFFAGDGHGHLAAGVKIGTGWTYPNLISIGDFNGDGHNDLLAEDAAGALWLYKGTGAGTFAGRVPTSSRWEYRDLVGGGLRSHTWLTYKGLY